MLLYNLSIRLYKLAIVIASPFHRKASLWLSGRKGQWTKLSKTFEHNDQPVVWFHCASLGEFEQGRPVIEAFKKEHPDYFISITFFSPSGYEVRKNYALADSIHYLPLDTPSNAKRFLDTMKPKMAFFVKYEFWFHFIAQCDKRNIPIVSISTIFRPEQHFFRKGKSFGKQLLRFFSHFYVQNEASKELLNSIDIHKVSITGDTRFDRVADIAQNTPDRDEIKAFIDNHKVIVLGSTWPEDMKIILPVINSLPNNIKVVIAPHEIHESQLTNIEKEYEHEIVRYSALNKSTKAQALLIDNIGMLSSLYKYADIAYIGGAFGKGLHNTLEAVAFGCPVIFGPNYKKFQEAKDLIALKGGYCIESSEACQKIMHELIHSEAQLKSIAETNKQYISDKAGATSFILEHSHQFMNTHA